MKFLLLLPRVLYIASTIARVGLLQGQRTAQLDYGVKSSSPSPGWILLLLMWDTKVSDSSSKLFIQYNFILIHLKQICFLKNEQTKQQLQQQQQQKTKENKTEQKLELNCTV